jgi:hypothetical protein
VTEFNSNNAKGGGIASGVAVIYDQISHLLGFDKIKDAVFGVDKTKPQSIESQFAAYLVDQTYNDIDKRPTKVLNRFVRVPEYDTDHVSVWLDNDTGEYTVTVRGTRAQTSDILEDIGVLVGNTNPNSMELDAVLDKFEANNPHVKYDIACHSLGASFVNKEQAEHGGNWDNVFLFNPASSAMQSDQFETEMANNQQYEYFVNHGDPISANLVHHMSHDTVQNTVFGDYQYSPIGSHSITQWFPEGFAKQDDQPLRYDNQETSFETAELQQDTKESREANLS